MCQENIYPVMDSLGRSPRLKDIPMKSAQDSHVIKNVQSQLWTARSTGSSYLSSGRSRICQWLTKTKRLKYTGCKKDVPLNCRLLKSLLHTYTGRSLRSWYPNRKDRTCSTSSLQLLSVICCYQHVSELSSFMVNKLNRNHISPTRNNLKCHIILDVTT